MLCKPARSRSIWLSAFGHALVLLAFLLTIGPKPMPQAQDAPSAYVPAYVPPAPLAPAAAPAKQPVPQPAIAKPQPIKTDPAGILTPPQQPPLSKQAMQAAVHTFKSTAPQLLNKHPDQEPLNLIGDQKIVKPLIRLLARAVGRTLTYPKAAVDFYMRGKVLIGFQLAPDGTVSNVRVLRSSGAGVLDNEAARSLRAISPLIGAGEWVKQPEFLIVGIIFG